MSPREDGQSCPCPCPSANVRAGKRKRGEGGRGGGGGQEDQRISDGHGGEQPSSGTRGRVLSSIAPTEREKQQQPGGLCTYSYNST